MTPSPKHRILLVEDDEGVRSCIAALLAEAGYHVVEAEDAAGALRRATQEPFAAIVCDQGLGDGTGLGLLRRLAETKPALVRRFILASGAQADEECLRFAETRPERTLFKPFTNETLLATVGRVVESAAETSPLPSPVAG